MPIGIVKEAVFLEHVIDDYHPETPKRLVSIYGMLSGLDQQLFAAMPSRMATHEEIALNHDMRYVEAIAATKGKPQVRLDPDTATSPKSYEAACYAAGGTLELIDHLMAGKVESGFALVRPPGHHAESNRAMGFCIFNNIGVGARYLEKKYGLSRILIVDFDLHHGNGTQHSFYRDSSVLYFSTHQYPYYPGTGWFEETGEGPGKGYTVNLPLSYGMGDDDYGHAFSELLVPVCEQYKPEMVMVSAGFDAYYNDPLGGMVVTEEGYAAMTRVLLDIAQRHAGGRILFALEGGYDIKGLTSSVQAVLLTLAGTRAAVPGREGKPTNEMVKAVNRSKEVLGPFWGKL